MCGYCKGIYAGKVIKILPSPSLAENQPTEAQIIFPRDDTPGIVLFDGIEARGYFDIEYCPMCGRKLI